MKTKNLSPELLYKIDANWRAALADIVRSEVKQAFDARLLKIKAITRQ